MDWTILGILGAATFAVVSVLDKRLISVSLPSLSSYYLWTGTGRFLWGALAPIVFGFGINDFGWHFAAAIVAGLIWGGALALMALGFRLEEASRVTAVSHSFPVISAFLGVIFLGEALGLLQWGAIVVVVLGAVMVSLRGNPAQGLPRLNRAFPVIVGSALCYALAFFLAKYAVEEVSVWTLFSIRQLGMAAVFLVLGRNAWREVPVVVGRRSALGLMLVTEFFLAHIALIFTLWAIEGGPVSVVSTLAGTRPLFVFLYTILLSASWWRFVDEPLERNTIALKLFSIVMIVLGVTALRLPLGG